MWDGQTLAADRQATQGGRIFATRKLYRIDADRIAAVVGTTCRGLAVVEWLRNGGEFPTFGDDSGNCVVVVHRDGRILRYESDEMPVEVMDRTHTAGSGCDFAQAALACGKTAVEAVEIANLFSVDCGLGVDTLTFDDP